MLIFIMAFLVMSIMYEGPPDKPHQHDNDNDGDWI